MEVKKLYEHEDGDVVLGTICKNNNIKKKCAFCADYILSQETFFVLGPYYSRYSSNKCCKKCIKILAALNKADENLEFA